MGAPDGAAGEAGEAPGASAVSPSVAEASVRARRPDRAVYVPRARRAPPPPVRRPRPCGLYTPPHARHAAHPATAAPAAAQHPRHVAYDSPQHLTVAESIEEPVIRPITEPVTLPIIEPDTELQRLPDTAARPSSPAPPIIMERQWDKDEDRERKELIRATEEINRSNRRLIKQSFDSDVLVISEPPRRVPELLDERGKKELDAETSADSGEAPCALTFDPDEQDWEAMVDDRGECLEPALLAELTAAVGRVAVERPRLCVAATDPRDPLAHVLEVYGFPSEFSTLDLLSVFSDFKDAGFEIKWVDDTHALAVFGSSKIAEEVLAQPHPLVRTRSLANATPESRLKARKCAEFLQPYRPRPETCAALARRLVTGALGLRLASAPAERLAERRLLTEAREKKRQAARHREAAWDGSLGDC